MTMMKAGRGDEPNDGSGIEDVSNGANQKSFLVRIAQIWYSVDEILLDAYLDEASDAKSDDLNCRARRGRKRSKEMSGSASNRMG